MNWVVFSYSLPSKSVSSPRVSLWRQLRRIGAISPTGGIYLLPAQGECVEAFQWLAQKVRQADGEALVMHVQQFEGTTDQQLIDLFRQARQEGYAVLDAQAVQLEETIKRQEGLEELAPIQDELDRLQGQYADVARIDYFECPEKALLAARLARIRQLLFPEAFPPVEIALAAVEAYRGKCWVTRPHPHVDRLACTWLIRHFIDPEAVIRYASEPKVDEVAFDISDGEFSHRGNLCTFETMLLAFGLDELALHAMAEVVHEIDLRDGQYLRLETGGVDALLKGWQLAGLSDAEMEARGLTLFEGLYAAFAYQMVPTGEKDRRRMKE